jgi:hypothetical protein
VVDGQLVLGDQTYDAVIGLGAAGDPHGVEQFDVAQFDVGPDLVPRLREHLAERGRLVAVEPAAPGLRVVAFGGADDVVYAFFNEGESAIEARVTLPSLPADAEWFDPFTQERRAVGATMGPGLDLVLERRQTLVLRSSPDGAAPASARPAAVAACVELDGWTATAVRSLDGMPSLKIGLGDWGLTPKLAGFSGSFRYTTTVALDSPAGPATLDLGLVGEAAKVSINEQLIGDVLWAPYRITIPEGVLVSGDNTVDILVSNTAANHYEGAGAPSGLMGPVRLTVSAG